MGFVILPRRRRAAKRELARRVGQLRAQLMDALTTQFEAEVDASARRIEDAVAPYVQFVESEREHLQQLRDELSRLAQELAALGKAARVA